MYTNLCKGCCSGVAGAVLISISVPESYFRVILYAYTVRDIASRSEFRAIGEDSLEMFQPAVPGVSEKQRIEPDRCSMWRWSLTTRTPDVCASDKSLSLTALKPDLDSSITAPF